MTAVFSFLTILALSFLIVRIGTVALVMTGLSEDVASFQSLSAFSGAGFTTTEAESVVVSQTRRTIIKMLIRLGSAGTVTAVSSLILSFTRPDQARMLQVVVLVSGLMVLVSLSRSAYFQSILTPLIRKALKHSALIDLRDYANLLHVSEGYSVVELEVVEDSWLAGRTLGELRLRSEGVSVLGVLIQSGEYIGAPPAQQVFEPGDRLLMYGRSGRLDEIAGRKRDDTEAHQEAVVEQKVLEIRQEEKLAD
ncbi:MAG: cation:proton antiporter regulatory subunit [Planctomycetaceae bacterium]